ncbi:MAG: 3'-5' exonuclease [Betaproteobacteria bacterium]|nr:3'-5' exonuclease [Betaproteobacteria bacterium]
MNAPVLAFDIETAPDTEALRAARGFPAEISEKEVVEMNARLRRQENKAEFLPPHLHRIAVISCVMRYFDGTEPPLKIYSLAPPEYDEKAATETFFRIIDKHTPKLVSWNGGGFDLPVLHWRAMKYGIVAPRYWQTHGADGGGDKFRWNSYTGRYHERHVDLPDILGMYQTRAGLDDAARLCGLPGKIGVGGAGVWDALLAGKADAVRQYCETDALLTYLLFARFQHFRGALPSLEEEHQIVREYLENADGAQWAEFLEKWRSG